MALGLNERHNSPAYHAGRFMAVCQHVQDLSDNEINATYVDRFFSSASANPAAVLPRLYRVAIHRLRKIENWSLRRDVEATLIQLHQQLTQSWPKHLGISDQGFFQLGYFHQIAALPRKDGRARILTQRGEAVKSAGEKTIADILFCNGLQNYEYERPLELGERGGKTESIKPDFTFTTGNPMRRLYIEYTGMEGDPGYDKQWGWKSARYRQLGARTIEDCLTDGRFGAHTLMQVRPNDRYLLPLFEERLLTAVRSFLQETDATPNGPF